MLWVSRLQDHGSECLGVVVFDRDLIGDEFMDHVLFFPDEPEAWIAPGEYKHSIQKELIITVFLVNVSKFMLEHLLAGRTLGVNMIVPEYAFEKRKRSSFGRCVNKKNAAQYTVPMPGKQQPDFNERHNKDAEEQEGSEQVNCSYNLLRGE